MEAKDRRRVERLLLLIEEGHKDEVDAYLILRDVTKGIQAMLGDEDTRTDVQKAADLIRDKYGSEGISEAGDQGLADMLWDAWPAYSKMDGPQAHLFFGLVYEEVYG